MRKNKSNFRVPFQNLAKVTTEIGKDYLSAVKKLLSKGDFILTSEVEDFEKKWAKFSGSKFSAGTSSGADAIFLSLTALGIGKGDEVITQGNAYNASVVAILRTGALPRFADIKSDTLTIDPDKIKPLVNGKTKAILPVHLYGQMNDMKGVRDIARFYNLFVIEDCAQAHGASFNGMKAGNFSEVAAWSFYPTKNLGAFGDAGAITTNNRDIYHRIIHLRNLGQKEKDVHEFLGYNMRLDPIQAIALSLKIKFLKRNLTDRQKTASYYSKLISESGINVVPQKRDKRAVHAYHLYVAKVEEGKREELRKFMKARGIGTAVHYPVPVYRQPFYKYTTDHCPITDEICGKIISLPFFVGITGREQEYIVNVMKQYLKR